jgi:hypothetical protein
MKSTKKRECHMRAFGGLFAGFIAAGIVIAGAPAFAADDLEGPTDAQVRTGVFRFGFGDAGRSKLHGGGEKTAANGETPTGDQPPTGEGTMGGNAMPGDGTMPDGTTPSDNAMPDGPIPDGTMPSGTDTGNPDTGQPDGAQPDTGTGAKTAEAIQDTDVYHHNDGKSEKFCTMYVGDKGSFVKSKHDQPDWVFLNGISGDCHGKDGWVWNGGSLQIQ